MSFLIQPRCGFCYQDVDTGGRMTYPPFSWVGEGLFLSGEDYLCQPCAGELFLAKHTASRAAHQTGPRAVEGFNRVDHRTAPKGAHQAHKKACKNGQANPDPTKLHDSRVLPPSPLTGVMAFGLYQGYLKTLMIRFKYQGERELASPLGKLMYLKLIQSLGEIQQSAQGDFQEFQNFLQKKALDKKQEGVQGRGQGKGQKEGNHFKEKQAKGELQPKGEFQAKGELQVQALLSKLYKALRRAYYPLPYHIVVPVPLSRERLIQRGYNQAWLLAQEISRNSGIPCVELLRRTKDTAPLKEMDPIQRKAELAEAFEVVNENALTCRPQGFFLTQQKKPQQENANSCRILLVDDIYTTGATATAVAQLLDEYTAQMEPPAQVQITVLTAAR